MSGRKLMTKFLSVLAFAALGFAYSGGAFACVPDATTGVMHPCALLGQDGGTLNGDGKFAWNPKSCVDTVTKTIYAGTATIANAACSNAPAVGYLYKGPDSAGKFYRTGTCWNKSFNIENACSTATGVISSSFTHHGIRIEGGNSDISLTLGEINPSEQLMTVVPGAVGTPAKVSIDIPDVLVKGFLASDNTPLGEGHFKYHVEYSIAVATGDPDSNKGGGNNPCNKCDPQNPAKGKDCQGCVVNQTCTNLSTTESQFTVKAFCQAGVEVTGYLTWIDPNPGADGDFPPTFTNCPADSKTCTLKLGGLPKTLKGTVDDTACGAIFGPLDLGNGKVLAQKQLLFFQQNYVGQCQSTILGDFGLENPKAAKAGLHRECNSDYGKANGFVGADPDFLGGEGFDNVDRGCVVVTNPDGTKFYHVARGEETAKSVEVTVDVTPESLMLKCKVDAAGLITDNGVATATICKTPEFDVTTVDIASLPVLFVQGDTRCDGLPCKVNAKPLGYSFATSSSGLCASPYDLDLLITYPTCTADYKGLAQVISNATPAPDFTKPVPLVLQGKLSGSTVIIHGSDAVNVLFAP